jgi:hypothetical protein
MAEVVIAASSGEDAQARGLAEALAALGFKATSGAAVEAEIAKLAEEAKCVVALWSGGAPPPWLAVLAALALDRKKLVCAETHSGATPAPFQAAPRVDLATRDRNAFKTRFGALIVEIDKLAPTEANTAAVPEALAKARAALMWKPRRPGDRQWITLAAFGVAVAVLFGVGFGAGRVINAVRGGVTPAASVAATEAKAASRPATPTVARAAPAPPPLGLAQADLDGKTWREIAARLDGSMAERIKAAAARGDSTAQALACVGHMAGTEGFMPSPVEARTQCDASAAQRNPAGLYLSWALRRTAPHAGIDEATARARLAEAANMGWTSALIDYGATLAPDGRGPIQAQAEAGRLWLQAAERGDPRGQFYYARWLRDSSAGPRDPAAAIPFLERASARNQVDALHMLGTFYRDGIGTARNAARARALYDRAARQNHPPSMFNLADMLRGGSQQDRARAIQLYGALSCMRDERQIQPMAVARLRGMNAALPQC